MGQNALRFERGLDVQRMGDDFDGNHWCEWVKKYNGLNGNLTNTKPQAEGFYDTLSATRVFDWGDDLAWDRDFEEQGVGSPEGNRYHLGRQFDMVFSQGTDRPTVSFRQEIDDAEAKHTEIVGATETSSGCARRL